MLCQNCGENEANVKYTQIINGVKKEMVLCEECSKELGIGNSYFNFNMPINLSSFLGEFLGDSDKETLPSFAKTKELTCKECGMSFDDFINIGKFGCSHCYDLFDQRIDPILKHIQGANRHIGRKANLSNLNVDKEIKDKAVKMISKEVSRIENLQEDLKKAVKEERYEDAAQIRDEIKKIEKQNK